MTASEFTAWQAYYRVEPFGEERADLRMAVLASTISACHGQGRKLSDFMLFDDSRNQRQSPEEMAAAVEAFATTHNARMKAKEAKAGG